jgi:hypothetical protein
MRTIFYVLLLLASVAGNAQQPSVIGTAAAVGPVRIVNIVNFIRLLEPRDPAITEDVLYQTVVRQIALMRKYRLVGTFLVQYDALIDPRYQRLLRSLPRDSFEIGAWWELPQPLIEKAGIRWRGRYPWDWRANIGFSTGYSAAERERIVDAYLKDFKRIFGYFPATVGSWFIDAHSLAYMSSKYGIVASCNCKDQYGTDGYTLWGGYWNQAYYPSRGNAYMPAQDMGDQIPVPIFRMLGSDPIRQYDNGLGGSRQGVVTLEPVYSFGGGDSAWVNWFFDAFTSGPVLGFNYTQAGQENSFTWKAMKKGLELQFPLIAKLRDEGKLRVERMASTGRWFRSKYQVTPATGWAVLKDLEGSDRKTVWFDSRFYRINLLWEKGELRIRDIHLFNERFPSGYESAAATSNECRFYTLPFVDGYRWSKPGLLAGMRVKADIGGKDIVLAGGDPVVVRSAGSEMLINWPLRNVEGTLEILLQADKFSVRLKSRQPVDWFLELNTGDSAALPFESIDRSGIDCSFEGMPYRVTVEKGECQKPHNRAALRIRPKENSIVLLLNQRHSSGSQTGQ